MIDLKCLYVFELKRQRNFEESLIGYSMVNAFKTVEKRKRRLQLFVIYKGMSFK